MKYVIGLDVGTTGTKALVVDEAGNVLGSGYQGYSLLTRGDCVEQDAGAWWKAAVGAVRQACEGQDISKIAAIGLSTQGATMLAVDAEGNPIGNTLTWMDTRASQEAEELGDKLGVTALYQKTGWRPSPTLDAAKILYMKRRAEYGKAKKYLSTLEFMNWKLTGEMVVDPTNAGIRQLYNIENDDWDDEILAAIGCTRAELPVLKKTGESLGQLTKDAAEALGLPQSTVVYNGAHDQYCASIGSGSVEAGDLLISTGTTWALLGVTKKPIFSETYLAACRHPVPGLYGNMVSLAGAGNSYQWARDALFEGESYQSLDRESEKRMGKNMDLFFIPWLTGAPYPYWSPTSRGGFLGADLSHDRYDFSLSVMEAAAFSVRTALDDFSKHGCRTESIRIMGGATKSAVWMKILSAVLPVPIFKMQVTDTCAVGAAVLALCGEGCFSSYREAAQNFAHGVYLETDSEFREYYNEKYEKQKSLLQYLAEWKGGDRS